MAEKIWSARQEIRKQWKLLSIVSVISIAASLIVSFLIPSKYVTINKYVYSAQDQDNLKSLLSVDFTDQKVLETPDVVYSLFKSQEFADKLHSSCELDLTSVKNKIEVYGDIVALESDAHQANVSYKVANNMKVVMQTMLCECFFSLASSQLQDIKTQVDVARKDYKIALTNLSAFEDSHMSSNLAKYTSERNFLEEQVQQSSTLIEELQQKYTDLQIAIEKSAPQLVLLSSTGYPTSASKSKWLINAFVFCYISLLVTIWILLYKKKFNEDR